MFGPNDDPFADLIPPAQDPSFTGFIPGRPKPAEPKEPKVQQVGDNLGIVGPDGSFTPTYAIPQKPDKDGKVPVDPAVKAAIDGMNLDELLFSVTRTRQNLKGGWATGFKGALGSVMPGSDRNNFLGNLQSLEGGVIMEKLAALKAASATGASGMGALSEKEGQRLASAVSSLSPDMSQEELETSMAVIERHAKMLQIIAAGKNPSDPAVLAQFGVPAMPSIGGAPPPAADPNVPPNVPPPGQRALKPGEEIMFGDQERPLKPPGSDEFTAMFDQAVASGARTKPQLDKFIADYNAQHKTRFEVDWSDPANALALTNMAKGKYSGSRAKWDINIDDVRPDGASLDNGTDTLMRGVGRGATLGGSTKLIAAAETLGQGGNYSYNLAKQRAIDDADRTDRAALYYGGEIAGSLVLPTGALGAGARATEGALTAGRTAAEAARAASGAVIRRSALEGSGYGAAYGAINTDGGVGDKLVGALGGAAVGGLTAGAVTGALTRGAPVVGGALGRVMRRGRDPELQRIADAENVRTIVPMGDPRARKRAGTLESNEATAPIIRAGVQGVVDDIDAGATRLGAGGTAQDSEVAGGLVQRAANRFITRSRGVATTLYRQAERLAGDATVTPRAALTQLRRELTELRGARNTNAGVIDFIENEIGRDLTQGPLTIGAIRQIRTSLRGRINEKNLTATPAEAIATRVLNSLQEDIAQSLPRGAATAYRRADAYYRERMTHIDDVLDKFIGGERGIARMSGEMALRTVKTMANTDGRRLGALMRNLEPEERLDVAATIAQSLGRRAPDEPFSLGTFMANTRTLSPSARRTIFGPSGAESIANLRTLTQRLQDAQSDVNWSRSGTTMVNTFSKGVRQTIAGALGLGGFAAGGQSVTAGIGAAAAAGTVMGAGAAKRYLSARALMSPRVSRWLTQAVDVTTPAQASAMVQRLSTIAQREPALANEVLPFQQFLLETMQTPLAASEPEGVSRDR